tara:strand:+ start:3172 stop:3957 length:786 start_codon:yes stop_codon:yes gene_type:complete
MDISELISEAYRNEKRSKPRQYIGASGIGQPCLASIAFSYRGYPDTEPDERLKRIFRDGHKIEYDVVKDMRKANAHVMENDPLTGKQWRWSGYGGLVMGNADGLMEVDGETIGVEIKSMNDAKHKEFVRKGIRGSHPNYYDQMQFMMGLSGLTRFVLVAYNKNNSSYHHQYIDFDDFRWAYLTTKVEDVLNNRVSRIATDESDWRCRGCFKRDACWKEIEPEEKSVRTCGNSFADNNGTLQCKTCGGATCTDWKLFKPRPA